jgi:hypothetical protein
MPPKNNIKSKAPVPSDSESSDEGHSSDEETQTKIVNKIKADSKTKQLLEDDSEEVEEVSDNGDSESDASSESSESEDEQDKKIKEKKLKESFSELTNRLDVIQVSIKNVDKEVCEIEKSLKAKNKERNDLERQRNLILKVLSKTHNDEVSKARKEKTKRKGSSNSGFNKEKPVPEILIKFLDLEEEACLARPQVMKKLNNKLVELGLKNGPDTVLSKEVIKELNLDKSYIDKVITFGGFQTFLATFYQNDKNKNIVTVS